MSSILNRKLASGLTVYCADCCDELADAFCTRFDAAWLRLPQVVRTVCCDHWNRQPNRPLILFHSFSAYRPGVSGGNVRDNGSELRYNVDVFPLMTENFRSTVIAHELGHVFLIALREPTHIGAFSFEDLFSCEFIARRLNELWGFDQQAVDAWLERELCVGKPYLRSTAGEEPMSEADYNQRVEGVLLKWGRCKGRGDLDGARRERDRLLESKADYFQIGTLPDAEFAALNRKTLGDLEKVAHGHQRLDDLLHQFAGES